MRKVVKEPLYSLTWNDNIMVWELTAEVYEDKMYIFKSHGYINSSKVTNSEVNYISNQNEVNKILDKLIVDKKNKGYRSLSDFSVPSDINVEVFLRSNLSKNKFDKNDVAKPMKAKPFKVGEVTYPAFVQPKLNGVRCVVSKIEKSEGLFGTSVDVSLKSREGIEYDVPNIKQAFRELFINSKISDDIFIDGEIYCQGQHVSMIAGAARNVANPINKLLYFIPFDLAIPDLNQEERLSYLYKIMAYLDKEETFIVPINTTLITSDEHFIEFTEECILAGYEGGILRDMYAPYYFGGRRNNMHKLKKFKVDKFLILDVVPFDKNPELGMFVCKNDVNNEIFNCTPIGDNDYRRDILINKFHYINRYAEIKYYERTKNLIPFHANVLKILK